MIDNLGSDLSVDFLAAKAGMSPRSFISHFHKAAGQTPARAVENLRVETARNLLSTTEIPVKRVAVQCGFGTQETMRRAFLRQLPVNPQDYRTRFLVSTIP